MSSNKLFEAAAEILAGSKKSASAMPPEKLPAEVHDAGGPTPQNYKNDDNSAKITPSTKSATAPTTKPSDASAKMEEEQLEGEVIAEKMHDDEKKEEMKKKMKEDIDALFADDSTISEEFKSKVSTIFEARVQDRVAQIEEQIESNYANMLEEAVESIKQELTEKVDDYLSYVVEQWMEENQIAIESGLRSEMTEEFISGLRNLFAEHYIDVPAEKIDLVDELATKVEELESSLNEEIERGIQTKKALVEARKNEITHVVCEGLTATQVEKIKSLAESVEFSTEDEYKQKLETIRENYFPSDTKRADEKQLHEELGDADDKKVSADPFVNAVANAISKTKL
jgi:membrane-associated HD superfamily phosphohydrolase